MNAFGDPIVAVVHDGHTLHVTAGRAFFLVSGNTVHRQYAPRTDADLARDVAEWSTRTQWAGMAGSMPYELVALSRAEVAALVAATHAEARAA